MSRVHVLTLISTALKPLNYTALMPPAEFVQLKFHNDALIYIFLVLVFIWASTRQNLSWGFLTCETQDKIDMSLFTSLDMIISNEQITKTIIC